MCDQDPGIWAKMHDRYLACRTARAMSRTFFSSGQTCLADQPPPIMLQRMEESGGVGHSVWQPPVDSASLSGVGLNQELGSCLLDNAGLDSQEGISVVEPEATVGGNNVMKLREEGHSADSKAIPSDGISLIDSAGDMNKEVSKPVQPKLVC
jgi:hypothetical protein